MRKPASFHLPRRIVLLLALLAVLSSSMALLMPGRAEACDTRMSTFDYFADPAKTEWVGQCTYCSNGTSSCYGTYPTPYYNRYLTICAAC